MVRKSRRAITLIETLLVITILGMVVSIAVWSLGAAADGSAANTLAYRWRAFDTSARMLAQQCGSAVAITRDDWSDSLVARPVRSASKKNDRSISEIRFGFGSGGAVTKASLLDESYQFMIDSVRIDRAGRSKDYAVEFEMEQAHRQHPPRRLRLRIHGLTGIVEEITDNP